LNDGEDFEVDVLPQISGNAGGSEMEAFRTLECGFLETQSGRWQKGESTSEFEKLLDSGGEGTDLDQRGRFEPQTPPI